MFSGNRNGRERYDARRCVRKKTRRQTRAESSRRGVAAINDEKEGKERIKEEQKKVKRETSSTGKNVEEGPEKEFQNLKEQFSERRLSISKYEKQIRDAVD